MILTAEKNNQSVQLRHSMLKVMNRQILVGGGSKFRKRSHIKKGRSSSRPTFICITRENIIGYSNPEFPNGVDR